VSQDPELNESATAAMEALRKVILGPISTLRKLRTVGPGVAEFHANLGTCRQERTNHLYHDNREGAFTDVAGKARFRRGRLGCIGDHDNDSNDVPTAVSFRLPSREFYLPSHSAWKSLSSGAVHDPSVLAGCRGKQSALTPGATLRDLG
jgi:hypothetical protein